MIKLGGVVDSSTKIGDNKIALGSRYTIKILDLDTEEVVQKFNEPTWVNDLNYLEKEEKLISGSSDGTIRIWDIKNNS